MIVQLPAQADLFIDGQPSRLTTTTRTIVTPALTEGESYVYTLRAELIQDGVSYPWSNSALGAPPASLRINGTSTWNHSSTFFFCAGSSLTRQVTIPSSGRAS